MQTRAHLLIAAIVLAVPPCYGAKTVVRDGSSMEKAIPLKQRGSMAVEEEMTWMMKLFHYTPVLASKAGMIDTIRKVKAGKRNFKGSLGWEHATLEHAGQWCSYWSFLTPRGQKKIYFDTGVSINTPGEVPRQGRARAEYMARAIDSMKLQ
jgi:hypothetical protein